MTSIVTSAGVVGDHPHGSFQRDGEAPPEAHKSAPAAQAQPTNETDVRLLIEDDQASGGFVYKTVDRRTGAVIRRLPLDGVLQLGAAPDYAAGALIRARA